MNLHPYLLFAFCFLASIGLYSQDAYHSSLLEELSNVYGLNGGEFIISDDELETLNSGFSPAAVQKSIIEIDSLPFKYAVQLQNTERAENFWNHFIDFRSSFPVRKDDLVLLVAWVRGIQGERGHGVLNHTFELSESPFTTNYTQLQILPSEWERILVPIRVVEDMETTWYKASFGHQIQQIEIAGIALINFKDAVTMEDLPTTDLGRNYAGRAPDAAWRLEAQKRIEEHRMEVLNIKVVDIQGNPIEGIEVHAEMLEHAFGFGSQMIGPEKIAHQYSLTDEQVDQYSKYLKDLTQTGKTFNWSVIGDALRWATWEKPYWPGNGQQHTINFFNYLRNLDMEVRGHMLVWPGFEWLPPDIEENQGDLEYISDRIKDHITTIVGHPEFKGRIVDWNVINEPVHVTDLENIYGGIDMYADWFKWARESDPDAKLYINEYGIISNGGMDLAVQDRYEEIITSIEQNGARVDGIGFEGHVQYPLAPPEVVFEIIDRYAQLGEGKEISISEYDALDVHEEIGGDYMRDLLTIVFSHPASQSFLMWGFWETTHWLDDAPIFRDDWSIKPSGQAFLDLVFNEWWTEENGLTNQNGAIDVKGFLGKYEIIVSDGNQGQRVIYNLTKDSNQVEITLDPTTSIKEVNQKQSIVFHQIYPNPVISSSDLKLYLPIPEKVNIALFDLNGTRLKRIASQHLDAGHHIIKMELSDLSSGTYICELITQSGRSTQKIQVIK